MAGESSVYTPLILTPAPLPLDGRGEIDTMLERLKHMLIKEFIQVFRDPRMRVVIFVIPCMQVLIIGLAVSTDVQHVKTAVYDLDNSEASRDLTLRFVRTEYFDLAARIGGDEEARRLLDRGDVSVVLRFNHGFGAALWAGQTVPLQILIDGTDFDTASIEAGYAQKIATDYSQQVLIQRIERAFGRVERRPTSRFKPGHGSTKTSKAETSSSPASWSSSSR